MWSIGESMQWHRLRPLWFLPCLPVPIVINVVHWAHATLYMPLNKLPISEKNSMDWKLRLNQFQSGGLLSNNRCFITVWYYLWIAITPWKMKILTWNLVHKLQTTYEDDPWHQWWPCPPRLQSGTFSILQVWLRGQGVLEALLSMLESWNLVHKSRTT